jgi:hypothetical protein
MAQEEESSVMMGRQTDQKELFSYTVDLDKRVRPDNPLRAVDARIDFTFVREEVKDLYGYNGNESVDPAVFEFDPPAGVLLMGQPTQEVGMENGTLSDEESAAKLVRQFVEAAIAQDYTKASKLLADIPAGWVEEQPYQQEQVVRLISVGKPELNAETGSLSVPCQVEVEKDGQTSVQSFVFRVQQVYGQSGRWLIINF